MHAWEVGRGHQGADDLPFLATMFHAVGLNVIDPRERKRDVLDASTRALRDMIAMSWLRTTKPLCTHARPKILRTFVSVVYTSRQPETYWLILGFIEQLAFTS